MNRRRWIIIAIVIALDLALLFRWRWRYRQEHQYDPVIRNAAQTHGLPPALIKAVIWQESRFDAAARGAAGELGLMQVMEDAAMEWATAARISPFAHELLLDPATNTQAGAYYLAKLMKRYTNVDNALPYALADYNAGRGNVLRWLKGPAVTNSEAFIAAVGFPSTRAYIQGVMQQYQHYQSSRD